jgi:hypothetical protein
LEHEEAGILLDERRSLIGDAGLRELRIAVLCEGWSRGEIEAGGIQAPDPIGLVYRGCALDRLDGLGRLRAIVVFDHFDFTLAIFELQPATLVDLMGPEFVGREMGDRRARCERTGFRTDHADLDDASIRSGGSHEWRGHRRRGRIFQKFASSHEILP